MNYYAPIFYQEEDYLWRSAKVFDTSYLFRFSSGKHLINAENLIILTNKLTIKEGMYFWEHYMHEQLCISRIFMNAENIRDICSQEYLLKSIQIKNNSELSTIILKLLRFWIRSH